MAAQPLLITPSDRFVSAEAFLVRAERAEDVPAREALLDLAMGPRRKRKASEAIRRGRLPAEGLSFSALDDAQALLGTVRLWHVAAGRDAADRPVPALLLGPLAVHPGAAGRGIGAALMTSACDAAARLGHSAILLVGDPEYYHRFGFEDRLTGALFMPGPFERRRLLARELTPGALSGSHGVIRPTGRAAAAGAARIAAAP